MPTETRTYAQSGPAPNGISELFQLLLSNFKNNLPLIARDNQSSAKVERRWLGRAPADGGVPDHARLADPAVVSDARRHPRLHNSAMNARASQPSSAPSVMRCVAPSRPTSVNAASRSAVPVG